MTTRSEALAAGLRLYSTGRPCKHGHDAPRYTSTGHCTACLKDARSKFTQLVNTSLATRAQGLALFAYKLHPDDHAAALAFCQALDLQRGRTPQATEALATPASHHVAGEFELPAEIARRRAQIEGMGDANRIGPAHMSAEMAATLKEWIK